jgi:hypothetical protein
MHSAQRKRCQRFCLLHKCHSRVSLHEAGTGQQRKTATTHARLRVSAQASSAIPDNTCSSCAATDHSCCWQRRQYTTPTCTRLHASQLSRAARCCCCCCCYRPYPAAPALLLGTPAAGRAAFAAAAFLRALASQPPAPRLSAAASSRRPRMSALASLSATSLPGCNTCKAMMQTVQAFNTLCQRWQQEAYPGIPLSNKLARLQTYTRKDANNAGVQQLVSNSHTRRALAALAGISLPGCCAGAADANATG